MGRNRVQSSNKQNEEILSNDLLCEFQVTEEEMYKVFLCITAHLQKGWSFKRIMSAIEDNSQGISSNVMQIFSVVGYKALSEAMAKKIIDSKIEMPSKD